MADETINTTQDTDTANEESAQQANEPVKTEREKQEEAVNLVIEQYGRGKMELMTPIKSRDKEVTELEWDFTILTGKEYVMALDADRTANAFTLSNTQALAFFAVAAARKTPGLDSRDIRDRLGMQDAVKAIQLAQVFYAACNRAGGMHITKE